MMKTEKFLPEEIEFISDRDIILTKNRLTEKMIGLLEELRVALIDEVADKPFPGIQFPSGKISKGENYSGFPYLVLDYPALFKKEDIFALRTIIWWGNHINNAFIIKGKYLDHFREALLNKTHLLSEKLFFVGDTPWLNEVNEEYLACDQVSKEQVNKQMNDSGFVKIVEMHSFHLINELPSLTLCFMEGIRKMLY